MKKLTIAALVTLGLGGVTYTAIAQQGGPGPHPRLEAVDANQDGNITKDEIAAHRADKFLSADTNGDNLVSADEFEAFAEAERERKREERKAKRFAKLDANGDGMITAEEHASAADERMDRMFERIDSDGDGVITEAEREAAKGKMRGKRGFGRRG
jgi:Ca2+-binding EF-hand superfamily protein